MKNNDTNCSTEPRIVAALDIGTTKIATIVGYQNEEGQIEVLGYGKNVSTGVQHGAIINLNKTTNDIMKSTEQAKLNSGQAFDDVYVGVAGKHIRCFFQNHSIRRDNGREDIIQQSEIDAMMAGVANTPMRLGEQIVEIIPQQFVIDKQEPTTEPVGQLGEIIEGEFQIVTGNQDEIRKIVRCTNDAGYEATEIILEPMASGLSCLTQEDRQNGVVLVDIGGGTTDVIVYYDGAPVYTEVIPFGGNVITQDIAQVCAIPYDLAEQIKVQHGTCIVEKSNKDNTIIIPQRMGVPGGKAPEISETYLANIIALRVIESIINNVKAAIDASKYKNKLMNGIVITGGGASLRDLKDLFQFELLLTTRIGVPIYGFSRTTQSELRHPMFATAMGLLKYGITHSPEIQEENSDVEAVSTPKKKEQKNDQQKPHQQEKEGDKFPIRIKRTMLNSIKKWFESLMNATA